MEVLLRLMSLGYAVAVEGDRIHLTWQREEDPDPAVVDPLLEELRRRKEEALAWLRAQPDYQQEAARARRLLAERGWCAVFSKVLGEVVRWARDGKVAIPERWKDAVRYHLGELEALTGPPCTGVEKLHKLHETKRTLSGEADISDPAGR